MRVGNTPLIRLSDKLYGKLEAVNPGGSIKDRPVKYILDRMDLKKGDQGDHTAGPGRTVSRIFGKCALRSRGDPRMHNYGAIRACITTSEISFFDYVLEKCPLLIMYVKKFPFLITHLKKILF